jgi:hypothetical protein
VNTYKPLHSGDFFEISFPEGINENGVKEGQIVLPDGPVCAPVQHLNDVNCTKVKDGTLKAKLTFGVGKMAGGRDF